MFKEQKKSGFSLVEFIVVIVILFILAGMFVSTSRFFRKEFDLNNNTEEIIAALRYAQNKTLASEAADQYGIYFDISTFPHQYVLFKGSDYSSRDTSYDEIHKLPEILEIYDIALGGGNETSFQRINGEAIPSGSISLRLTTDHSKNKTIYIEDSGKAGLISPAFPSNGRVIDSRHVHFDLGWSMQNATTLKFSFPAIPQTEIVDMASFFDGGKTEFDWQGTFSVGGKDQLFRIHTHSLDSFNTLLCINRDRNEDKTDQEVLIYVVDSGIDKDIAHYLADEADAVIKGSYVATMEKQ